MEYLGHLDATYQAFYTTKITSGRQYKLLLREFENRGGRAFSMQEFRRFMAMVVSIDDPSLKQQLLQEIRRIVSLELENEESFGRELMQFLTTYPHFTEIDASNRHTITGDLSHPIFGGLTKLVARCYLLYPHHIPNLVQLVSLRALNLSTCHRLTDPVVLELTRLPNLEQLNLSGWNRLTDLGIAHLGNLTNLQELILSDCSGITGATFPLASLRGSLTVLDSSGSGVTNAGFGQAIEDLGEACEISQQRNEARAEEGSQEKKEPERSELRELKLNKTKVSGEWTLVPFENLKMLDVSECSEFTDAGVKWVIETAPGLETVKLSDSPKVSSPAKQRLWEHLESNQANAAALSAAAQQE